MVSNYLASLLAAGVNIYITYFPIAAWYCVVHDLDAILLRHATVRVVMTTLIIMLLITRISYFSDTESVMVVVLPEGKVKDASLRIQHTLIEAFCRENEVKVIKVSIRCPLPYLLSLHTFTSKY